MTKDKPKALEVIPENIPAELKQLRRWVCWRYEMREGKWTKPPIVAGSQEYANSTDEATWRTFDESLAAYHKHPDFYDGIGFSLCEADGFVGIDIDHVRDAATGKLNLWTAKQKENKHWTPSGPLEPLQIANCLDTYTEVSPSGCGLRIVTRGELPAAIKHGDFEAYKCSRYLTLTGHVLRDSMRKIRGAGNNLGEICAGFDALKVRVDPTAVIAEKGDVNRKSQCKGRGKSKTRTADEIIDKINSAENAPKFRRLFVDGDLSGHGNDASVADAALCAIVVSYCGESKSLLDDVFRKSKLMRQKWDDVHHSDGRTYGQGTIDYAFESRTWEYDWSRAGKSKGGGKGSIICDLAEIILQSQSFAVDAGGRLYRFVDGAYRLKAEQWIKARVKTLLIELGDAENWSSKLANEVLEYIRVDRPSMWERPPVDSINLRNGLLRVLDHAGQPIAFDRLTLAPHDPAWLSSIQLPVSFDPAADCPEIKRFVADVFPADAVELAWEIPGYLCRPITDIQKAILLIGQGGNGKSTWLTLITAFLGKVNISSLTLHRLEADKFATAQLYGKLANICPDLPTEHLTGTSVFKAITGGDPLVGEYKFLPQFEFTPFSRLIFSANAQPTSHDSSQGFFDRWLVIPFDNAIRGTEKELARGELDAMLSAPTELSGLLNKALQALPSMHRRHSFSASASTAAAGSEFKATTDPLAMWLERNTVDDPNAYIAMATLLAAYNGYLERKGRPCVSGKKFGTDLHQYRPRLENKQRMVAGKLVWCYIGIGLKPVHQHTESDAPASPDSRRSRHSHDNPILVYRGGSGTDGRMGAEEREQEEADRVNRVNGVKGHNKNGHPFAFEECDHN